VTAGRGEVPAGTAIQTVVFAVSDVRVFPEVIDFTLVTNAAGAGGLAMTMIGAFLRYDHDRLARLTLLGTVLGGAVIFLLLIAVEVL
jgi:hypothetical protein